MHSSTANAQLKARLDDERLRNFYNSKGWTNSDLPTISPSLHASQKSVRFTPQVNNQNYIHIPKNSGVLKNVKNLYPQGRLPSARRMVSTQEEAR